MQRAVSEAALSHLIRAQPAPNAPLERISPLSPLKWGPRADKSLVEEVSFFRRRTGVPSWQGRRRHVALTSDGRDLLLKENFGKSPESLREVASVRLATLPPPPVSLPLSPAKGVGGQVLPQCASAPVLPRSHFGHAGTASASPPKTCCGGGGAGGACSFAAGGASSSSTPFLGGALPSQTAPLNPGLTRPPSLALPSPGGEHVPLRRASFAAGPSSAGMSAGMLGANSQPMEKKPRPVRLEVITGLRSSEEVRCKARGALLMSDTLATRGSLQNRSIVGAKENSHHALLSPRREGSDIPHGKRASAASAASGTAATATAASSAAWDVNMPYESPHPFGPTVGGALKRREAAPGAPSPGSPGKASSASFRRSSGAPHSPAAHSPGGAAAAAAAAELPQVRWQVAQVEAPPVEVEQEQLRNLGRDALVWTDGLNDWLPLGDLPEELPPEPLAARGDHEDEVPEDIK